MTAGWWAASPLATSWVLVTQALVAWRRDDALDALDAEDRARRCLAEVRAESLVVADALEALAGALVALCNHAENFKVTGDLTIKGVTKPVVVDFRAHRRCHRPLRQ